MRRSRLGLSFGDVLDLNLLLDDEPPPSTDVVVIPQDVHLLLGELTALEEPPETRAELLAAALRQRPRRRGTLVVPPPRRGEPLVLQAIVYDFDDTPPARELHVFEVLLAAFEEAKARGLGSLALHPLGTRYAGIAASRFLDLLIQVCFSAAELGTSLRHFHLLLGSADELARYRELLESLAGPGSG
jgi:hypothetical protein